MKILVIAVTLLLSITTTLHANTVNVPDDFQTLERAIYSADKGDTVLVQPGTYTENLYIHDKDIVIASLFLTTGNRMFIDSTVINGRTGNHVFTFREGTEEMILVGFTITRGNEAGIYCSNGAAPLIRDCIITENSGAYGGGILILNESSPVIRDCWITNNTGGFGGGILIWNSDPIISNCVISDNYAANGGGGIYVWDSDPLILNCTIYHNSTYIDGGGINCRSSEPTILNCTVSRNDARGYGGGIHVWGYSNTTIVNSVFWNNSKSEIGLGHDGRNSIFIAYSDIDGGEDEIRGNHNDRIRWGEGNIDGDPLFIDPANGDFYLSADSPCIDTGDPDSDRDPDDTRADMGAYFFDHRPDVVDRRVNDIPNAFALESVYPNPFNTAATITFNMPYTRHILLAIYDMSGREVAVLADELFRAGQHSLHWNAGHLPSGMYQARLTTPESSQTVRMILIK